MGLRGEPLHAWALAVMTFTWPEHHSGYEVAKGFLLSGYPLVDETDFPIQGVRDITALYRAFNALITAAEQSALVEPGQLHQQSPSQEPGADQTSATAGDAPADKTTAAQIRHSGVSSIAGNGAPGSPAALAAAVDLPSQKQARDLSHTQIEKHYDDSQLGTITAVNMGSDGSDHAYGSPGQGTGPPSATPGETPVEQISNANVGEDSGLSPRSPVGPVLPGAARSSGASTPAQSHSAIRELLTDWPVEGHAAAAEAMVEALLRTAHGPAVVRSTGVGGQWVLVEVIDESRTVPVRDEPDKKSGLVTPTEAGRVTDLLDKEAGAWGFEIRKSGERTRWFQLFAPAAQADPSQAMPNPALELTFERGEVGRGASSARDAIARLLTQAGWYGKQIDGVVLAATEVLTNVDLYAKQGGAQVRAYFIDNVLRFEVTDTSRGLPKWRPESDVDEVDEVAPSTTVDEADVKALLAQFDLADLEAGRSDPLALGDRPDGTHGRGSKIIWDAATALGVTLARDGRPGKTVWMEVQMEPAPTSPGTQDDIRGAAPGHAAPDDGAPMVVTPFTSPTSAAEPDPSGDHGELSPSEVEILGLVAEGNSNQEVGALLDLSLGAVEDHLARIGEKLGTETRAGMTAVALRTGILPIADIDPGDAHGRLTAREVEVLGLAAEGKTNKEIGAAAGISADTARIHLDHAGAKLGSRDRARMVAVALRTGILPIDPTAAGEPAPVPESADQSPSHSELADHEIEMLGLVAKGMSNGDVGAALGIPDKTVRSRMARIGSKLGAGSRAAMVAIAIRSGVLPVTDPALADFHGELSAREIEILDLVAEGKTTSDIAEALAIKPRAVETHLVRIGDELGVGDRAGMVAVALRTGILPIDPAAAGEPTPTTVSGELSAREIEVLGLVAEGKTNKEISAALGISPVTVSFDLTRIGEKLGTGSQAAMVATAVRSGILLLTHPSAASESAPTGDSINTPAAPKSAAGGEQDRSPKFDSPENPPPSAVGEPASAKGDSNSAPAGRPSRSESESRFAAYRQALTRAYVSSSGAAESDPVTQSLAQMTESVLQQGRQQLNFTQRNLVTEAARAAHQGRAIDILQGAAVDRLARAVHALAPATPDEPYPSDPHAGSPRYGGVTDREVEVLELVAADKTNNEIGVLLGKSAATVKTQLSIIGGKLGNSDRAAMVAIALRTGILP